MPDMSALEAEYEAAEDTCRAARDAYLAAQKAADSQSCATGEERDALRLAALAAAFVMAKAKEAEEAAYARAYPNAIEGV